MGERIARLKPGSAGERVLLNYANPVEAMFYTSLTAYSEIPGEATVRELLDKGYTVIVNDKGDVPAGIATLEGVRLKKLAEAPAP